MQSGTTSSPSPWLPWPSSSQEAQRGHFQAQPHHQDLSEIDQHIHSLCPKAAYLSEAVEVQGSQKLFTDSAKYTAIDEYTYQTVLVGPSSQPWTQQPVLAQILA